jgi:hypothetical protein
MVTRIISISLIISFLSFGCAPPKFIPKDPPIVKFDKTPPYKVDLSTIVKPDKPVYIWTDEKFKPTNKNDAKYLVLTKKEFAKFVAQLKIKKTFEEIIGKQEIIINTNIDIINSLKEYVALEQMKSKEYRDLWVDSENAYRQERYYNELNNAIMKGFLGFISIGALVALIIAL